MFELLVFFNKGRSKNRNQIYLKSKLLKVRSESTIRYSFDIKGENTKIIFLDLSNINDFRFKNLKCSSKTSDMI